MQTPLTCLQIALGCRSRALSAGRPSSSILLPWIVSIGLITACKQAQGQTVYYVNPCKEFIEGRADGTEAHPYPTLTGAAVAAPAESTVLIQGAQKFGLSFYAGTVPYPETGLFAKQLKIQAKEGDGAAVVGQVQGTRRLWQLTGETDLERGVPTASRTESRYGLRGTDLGSSFEHQGRIYFLFGDTWPNPDVEDPLGLRPTNSDSIGWIPTNTDPEQPVSINIITAPDGYYLPPILRTSSGQYVCLEEHGECQAEYEVPLGGFSANGQMYVFFSTDHTKKPPGPQEDYMGRSVLSRLYDLGSTARMFTYLYDVSCLQDIAPCSFPSGLPKPPVGHFINVAPVVVNNADVPGLQQAMGSGSGVLLWGTGPYHESDPYLAYIPIGGVENPESWKYAVTDGQGNLQRWGNNESDATPLFVQECGVLGSHCRMGEFSVTWNPFLRKWLMLYNHGNPATSGFSINYRVAANPWGPWDGPYILYDPACDRGFCHFIHVEGCDAVGDDIIPDMPARWGIVYAPYVISAFTKADATTTTIYWAMSTWNPYQVMLMKSVLRLSDARRVDHPSQPQ
jgi:hypothetical protein